MLYKTRGKIRRHLKEGADFEHPAAGETATPDEYGKFSDKYTGRRWSSLSWPQKPLQGAWP